jgi:predicted transcriptional regulator
MPLDKEIIVALTADIVAAHVANNVVAVNDMPKIITSVYAALAGLGEPDVEAPAERKPAVSARSSIKPDYLISMIDGKPYKMLKRHLTQNGHTPQSYRTAFNLPRDYPMTAPNYAAKRSELARKLGLGRQPTAPAAAEVAEATAPKPRKRRTKSDEPADV